MQAFKGGVQGWRQQHDKSDVARVVSAGWEVEGGVLRRVWEAVRGRSRGLCGV